MKPYSFVELSWKHYTSCKKLLENVFYISEIPFFINSWRNRSEKESFVVYNTNCIIGFALVDNKHKIQYICVDKEYQNQKIGSTLLSKIIDSTSEKRSLWLTTGNDERLIKWYSRYGFSLIRKNIKNGLFIGADMVRRNRCRSGFFT